MIIHIYIYYDNIHIYHVSCVIYMYQKKHVSSLTCGVSVSFRAPRKDPGRPCLVDIDVSGCPLNQRLNPIKVAHN